MEDALGVVDCCVAAGGREREREKERGRGKERAREREGERERSKYRTNNFVHLVTAAFTHQLVWLA